MSENIYNIFKSSEYLLQAFLYINRNFLLLIALLKTRGKNNLLEKAAQRAHKKTLSELNKKIFILKNDKTL